MIALDLLQEEDEEPEQKVLNKQTKETLGENKSNKINEVKQVKISNHKQNSNLTNQNSSVQIHEGRKMPELKSFEPVVQEIKFISKEARERLQKEKEDQEKKNLEERKKQIKQIRKEYDKFKYKEWKKKLEREEERRRTVEEEEEIIQKQDEENSKRKQKQNSRSRSRSRSKSKDKDRDRKEREPYKTSNSRATVPIKLEGEDKELLSIKMQYLGLNKEKKKILKPSEKFKNIFNFEWDTTEDTAIDYNPIYNNKMEANLLFGRGIKGGFDVTEQKQTAVKYDELVHKYDPGYLEKKKKEEEKEKEKDPEREKDKESYNKDRDKLIKIYNNNEEDDIIMKEDNKKKKDQPYEIGDANHWSTKKTNEMSERDWRIFREDNDIIIKGGRVPQPMRQWFEGSLPPYILDAVKHLGYETPTPIQMQAIPIGMQRKDLVGIAPTGSGKTTAFLIPLICYMRSLPPMDDEISKDGPNALIMIPSRELAPQIEREFQYLTVNMKLRSLVMVGGRKEEDQAFMLKKGCELLIGTPGRIKDALQKKYLVLDQCSWVVLDEADKMIDMGFEADVNFILDSIGSTMKSDDDRMAELQEMQAKAGERTFRVTHMFSATMPAEVERISKKYLRAFCYISIGEPGGGQKDVEQHVEFIGENQKKSRLNQILNAAEPPIIVFANEKKSVEVLAKIIEKWGFNCVVYHGSKTQQQRESAVDGFKNKKYNVLIATDLAGRGLHIEGVTMVINFDAPKSIRDFVHRTGRTGRAGKKGLAYTFLTKQDEQIFYDMKEFLIKNNQFVPPELDQHEASRIKPGSIAENVPRRKQILYAQ